MPPVSESVIRLDSSGRSWLAKLRFGGGIHSAKNARNIDAGECSEGENFSLKLDTDDFSPRAPFDLVGTATNAQEIRGFVEFKDSSGNVSALVQAGGVVYNWDGGSTFTQVGTFAAGSRLRGDRKSTSPIDDFVIISDLAKLPVVKTWDGTSFVDFVHNLSSPLFAKYCRVENERAFFGNVKSGTDTPHVVLVSGALTALSIARVGTLTVSTKPATGNTVTDPVWMTTPNLRPINGLVPGFGLIAISTEDGDVFKLTGGDATDFAFEPLYLQSGVAGDEAIVNTGNDIILGLPGRMETLIWVISFGDVVTDDLTRWIADQTLQVTSWTIKYDRRLQRLYGWPLDGSEVFVMHNPLLQGQRGEAEGVSPWSKWTTTNGNGDFRQTAAASIWRPTDDLEVMYFGGSAGEVFQMEGSGSQDGGDSDIVATRTTGLFEMPVGQAYNIKGEVFFRKQSAVTLTITLQSRGESIFDAELTVSLPAIDGGSYWGGDVFWGGEFFWGVKFAGEISKDQFFPTTSGTDFFKLQTAITASVPFDIEQINLQIEARK